MAKVVRIKRVGLTTIEQRKEFVREQRLYALVGIIASLAAVMLALAFR